MYDSSPYCTQENGLNNDRTGVFSLLGLLVLILQSVLILVMYSKDPSHAFSEARWDSKLIFPVVSNDNMTHRTLDPVLVPTPASVSTQSSPKAALMTSVSSQKTRILLDSSPPEAVELLSVDHPGIRQRHECIAKIRARHEQLLAPLVTPNADHPHSLLVDPAYHRNVGDSMLTLGELIFLKRRGFTKCEQCHYKQANGFYPPCEQVIGSKPPATIGHQAALWHAGGNWGDLYRSVHLKRMESFSSLLAANYSLVGMPQSWHYGNKRFEKSDATLIKSKIVQGLFSPTQDVSILSNATALERVQSRVTFTWREHESYDQAVKLYPFVNNLVVPDIAFQLGPFLPIPPTGAGGVDIVLFLRTDKESSQKAKRSRAAVQKLLNTIPGGKDLSFTIVDWDSRLAMFKSKDFLFTDTAIQLLSLGKVVVCDRLHASILAYLSGLPFVYINQSTGKVEKVLRVAFESWEGCQDGETSMYAGAQNLQDALGKAIQFLDKYDLKKTTTAVSAPISTQSKIKQQ